MQPSRRSFLFGRRLAPATPWQRFYQRLARSCLGRVDDISTGQAPSAARLAPAGVADVLRARALCVEYGVRLALAGTVAHSVSNKPTLWLDPAVALTRLEPLADTPGVWRAEPGVLLADMQAAGLTQFADASADMTLADWLADGGATTLCAPGHTAASGVLGLDVMLADGTRAALGPFGERDVQPLRSAAVQQLIPKLFELVSGDDAQLCLRQPRWPARIRLDALRPQCGAVNLAHVLLGQGATLAWLEAAILVAPSAVLGGGAMSAASMPVSPECVKAAARLDAAAQSLFDPQGLFQP